MFLIQILDKMHFHLKMASVSVETGSKLSTVLDTWLYVSVAYSK